MKNVFICTTQYQLFNIVNIINQKFSLDTNDLLIVGFIPELKTRIIDLAKKSNKFNHILFVKTGRADGTLKSYLGCIFKILFPCLIHVKPYEIDRLFITSTEVFSRIIAYKFFTVNKLLKLYYYEDGLESYMEVLDSSTNNRTNYLLGLRFGYSLISKCRGMYVYKPKYVISNPYNIILYMINPVQLGSSYAKELYNIFSVEKPAGIKSGSKLFLDAWFINGSDKADSARLLSIIQNVVKESLVIKPHPSNYDISRKNNVNYNLVESKDNFEIMYMADRLINVTLISAFSTACLLPKIIFNEEPNVILLYRLYERYPGIWKNGEEFYLRVQNDYKNPKRLSIPRTQAELEEALRRDDFYG